MRHSIPAFAPLLSAPFAHASDAHTMALCICPVPTWMSKMSESRKMRAVPGLNPYPVAVGAGSISDLTLIGKLPVPNPFSPCVRSALSPRKCLTDSNCRRLIV